MGQFNGMTLTDKGLALQSKVQTGLALHFTRVALGDGILPDGTDLRKAVAMIHPVLDLPIISVTPSSNGTASLEAVLRNTGLKEGFFAREMAVFAKDTDGTEILYSYAFAGVNSDYIPAGGGADVVEYILNIYMVIGRATNVTAVIDSGLAFVTQQQLAAHRDAENPHPKLPMLASGSTGMNVTHIWAQEGSSGKLHAVPFPAAQQIILGGDGTDLTLLRNRIGQTEREVANIALQLEAAKMYPDYNCLLAEDFVQPDLVDQFSCDVTSIVAGDDSIDVSTLTGIVTGAIYTISDGVSQERVQVKSVVRNGSIMRIILAGMIQATYLQGQTKMYRTTSQIVSASAQGSGERRTLLYQPTTVWSGISGNTPVSAALVTTAANAGSFTITGSIGFSADGQVTLV